MTFVAGVVLAAGSSRRLGQPKQLLPLGGSTLLDATLAMARSCGFEQLIVTLGSAAAEIRAAVDLDGLEVTESVRHREGCSASIAAALSVVDPRADGIVLLLGDQPGIAPESVAAVVAHASVVRTADGSEPALPIVVGRYDDGVGHPFWFGRTTFAALETLHGDKAVWKVIESGAFEVAEVRLSGRVPPDVDTWDDYEQLRGRAR